MSHPSSSSFATRLQSLRETAGLSQYALAKRSGLSKQAVSNLELGAREPSWVTVQRLAIALAVSCEEFTDPAITLPAAAAPRRRGRPRKPANETAAVVKRPRGRPRKGK